MQRNKFYIWQPTKIKQLQLYSSNSSSSVGTLRPGEVFKVESFYKVKEKKDSNWDVLTVRIKLGELSYKKSHYLLIQQKDYKEEEFKQIKVSGLMFS